MILCEVYGKIECLGIQKCPYGDCERLVCDGTDCEYWLPEHCICTHANCCKKERY